MALSPYRNLVNRRWPSHRRETRETRRYSFGRGHRGFARRGLSSTACRHRIWRALPARKLADAQPHSESRHAARQHERRRRWARWSVLSQFRPSLWQAENPQQVLHGVRLLQALPRRHYNQWFSSAHHFSSFNNQWYRKAIEYMQDTVGTQPSKWCGGCHDPAVLYSGLMDTPIKQIVHRPESQAGLGCMMCHSIANVKSTMGQADFIWSIPNCMRWRLRRIPWRAPCTIF